MKLFSNQRAGRSLVRKTLFIYFQASKKLNEMLGALYPPETTTVDPEQEESSEEPPAPETKPEIVKNLPGKRTAALFLSSDEDPDFIAIGEK